MPRGCAEINTVLSESWGLKRGAGMCPPNRPLGLADSETHTYWNPLVPLQRCHKYCSNLRELPKFIRKKSTSWQGCVPLVCAYVCMCMLCMYVLAGCLCVWCDWGWRPEIHICWLPQSLLYFLFLKLSLTEIQAHQLKTSQALSTWDPTSPSVMPGFLCECQGSKLTSLCLCSKQAYFWLSHPPSPLTNVFWKPMWRSLEVSLLSYPLIFFLPTFKEC